MKITGIILLSVSILLMILCIIKGYKLFNKISAHILPVFICAILFVILKIAPLESIKDTFLTNSSINPLKIVVLLLSLSFLSIYLDELGFFRYLASVALARGNKNQFKLFIKLYILISILTIFTSNDIIILTFTPFIIFFAKNSKISPLPYLIGEFIAANTWSMFLLIGNTTNIYLSTFASISFFEYVKVMAVPTICCGLVSLGMLLLIFKNELKKEITPNQEVVKLRHKYLLADGIGFLIVCIILLSISSYIHLEMSYITLICMLLCLISSLVMCLIKKAHYKYLYRALKRLPYEVVPFLLSMFILVLGLQNIGITDDIIKVLSKFNSTFSYGISSTLLSNIMNNIPSSILFASLSSNNLNAVYASIVGTNLGAFLTPLGAIAGILFTNLCENSDVHISFLKFSKYGIMIEIPSLLTTLLILNLIL